MLIRRWLCERREKSGRGVRCELDESGSNAIPNDCRSRDTAGVAWRSVSRPLIFNYHRHETYRGRELKASSHCRRQTLSILSESVDLTNGWRRARRR